MVGTQIGAIVHRDPVQPRTDRMRGPCRGWYLDDRGILVSWSFSRFREEMVQLDFYHCQFVFLECSFFFLFGFQRG